MSMKLTFRTARRVLGGTAMLCAAAVLPGTALASAASAQTVTAAKAASPARGTPRCLASQTTTWLGVGLGGGTAGTIYYPVEFTNSSKKTCALWGYPRVATVGPNGHRIGQAARHLKGSQPFVVLRPGWTAHVRLGMAEAGNVCSKPVSASGFKIRAPHQGEQTWLTYPVQACRHKRALVVTAVRPGVGIP